MNTYEYVAGNPLKYSDPFGLETQICCKQVPVFTSKYHCYVSKINPNTGAENTLALHGFRTDDPSIGIILKDDAFDMGPGGGRACGPPQDDGKWSCAEKEAKKYPNPSFYDAPSGPNSNTFASTCSNACGITPPSIAEPGNVFTSTTPGWGKTPSEPWTSEDEWGD